MSHNTGDNGHSQKRIRVAIITPSIAPYAVPEGKHLASRPELTTKHFFARSKEPGREWRVPDVLFSHEIVGGPAIRLSRSVLYFPLTLPIRLFKFKPDVIVTGQLGTLSLLTYLYAIPARVPVLIGWEGTPHTETMRPSGLRKWARRLIASYAAGFYYYTPAAKRYLKCIGTRGPFFFVPNSVDSLIFTPPYMAREENVLLYVGQLVPRKGVELLMKSFLEVLQHEPSAQLWVAGNGPLKPKLMQMLPTGCSERVRWFGFLDQQQTASLYKRASVFVYPTLLDYTPLALVEAATSGLPIVTSPFAGNSEIMVREGKNGFIVDPMDTTSFARAIVDVLHSANKQAMYETSLMIAKRHTPEQTAQHFLTGIVTVLKSRAHKQFLRLDSC